MRERIYFLSTKAIPLMLLLGLASKLYSAQTNTVSFRALTGIEYSNVVVVMLEKDGVLLRYGEEFRYSRVKFTNMSEEAQLLCG